MNLFINIKKILDHNETKLAAEIAGQLQQKRDLAIDELSSKKNMVNYWLFFAEQNNIKLTMSNFNKKKIFHIMRKMDYSSVSHYKLNKYSKNMEVFLVSLISRILTIKIENYQSLVSTKVKLNPRLSSLMELCNAKYRNSLGFIYANREPTSQQIHDFTTHLINVIEEENRMCEKVGALVCLDSLIPTLKKSYFEEDDYSFKNVEANLCLEPLRNKVEKLDFQLV